MFDFEIYIEKKSFLRVSLFFKNVVDFCKLMLTFC